MSVRQKFLAFEFKTTLHQNITEMTKKANPQLYRLRFFFNHEELLTVYKGYVRPPLEYCDSTKHL